MIPNIELKWARTPIQKLAVDEALTVLLPEKNIKISNLELQIAFKEHILKSPKDKEDARHLRKITEKFLDKTLIQTYKEMLRDV